MKKVLAEIAVSLMVLVAAGALYMQHQSEQPRIIGFNPGGQIDLFIEDYEGLRRSGRHAVLDGLCLSACTLVVGLMPAERLCTTPYGQLGFHSAYYRAMGQQVHSSEGTRILWQIYPEPLRQLLRARGWDGSSAKTNEHPDLLYIEGAELRTVVRAC